MPQRVVCVQAEHIDGHRTVDATVTPQAAVYTSAGLAYRGRIDNSYSERLKKHRQVTRHDLRQVIGDIENRSPIELIAIGIGHDVTRYYRRAVTVTDAEELAGVMTDKLAELFDEDLAWRQLHRTVPSGARTKRRKLN